MKKALILLVTLTMIFTFSLIAFAEDDIVLVGDEHIRTWFCWEQDGNETTFGKVKTSDRYIVSDLSSNWVIKAQDAQSKITDTYWSPATVWTVNASQDFELAFEVFGNTEVQIGFLHCVGASSTGGVNYPCSADGHELVAWCKLYESEDGNDWTEVDSDILPAEDALVSGMTGYENTDIHPYNGDGVAEWSEAYFVIKGTVSEDAKYVKYWFKGNGRNHYWDPCVRDAIFTAPVGTEWEEGSDTDESSEEEYDPWMNVAYGCSYEVLSGTVRNDGYGDPEFTKLTDGVWSVTGSDAIIGAFDSPTGSVKIDFGASMDIERVATDLWYGDWGIGEPISVTFFLSEDGSDFTELGTVPNSEAESGTFGTFSKYLYTLNLDEAVSGRYLKVEYTGSSHVWTSEIEAYTYTPEDPSESEETSEAEPTSEVEPTSEAAESSNSSSAETGDTGMVALAIVSLIALAGVIVIKRK